MVWKKACFEYMDYESHCNEMYADDKYFNITYKKAIV